MATMVKFDYDINEKVFISEIGKQGLVTAYFVGLQGTQYMVDWFDDKARKITAYLYPAQLMKIERLKKD